MSRGTSTSPVLMAPRLGDEPWKQRFRAPRIAGTQVARQAPSRGLVASTVSGVWQLHAWDVSTGALRQLTSRPEGVRYGLLSRDGRHVYYLDDLRGSGLGHYVRMPCEGGAPQDLTPDLPPYPSAGLSASPAGHVGFTVAGPDGYRVYCLDPSPDGALGSPRELYHSQSPVFGPVLSYDGDLAVIRVPKAIDLPRFRLLAIDTRTGRQVREFWDGSENDAAARAFSPLPGDARLLASTDRSAARRPVIWNPRTGDRVDLPIGGLKGSVRVWDWSLDGDYLLLDQFRRAVRQLYAYQLPTGRLTRLQHPAGTIEAAYFAPSGEIFVEWHDSRHPLHLVAFDPATGARRRTVLAPPEAPPGRPFRSVTFGSSDGREVQGWLAVPDGEGPFPAILETHPGPAIVVTDGYAPGAQAWLDHGFAYLAINQRGSTTFGHSFRRQILGNIGYWEVEDMAAARSWLLEQGIAWPDQVFLTGFCYGGYLTLLALGTRPELWAGGMAVSPVADWVVAYEETNQAGKSFPLWAFGGTPQERPDEYARASPITYAARVTAPVLIIHGLDDTLSPPRASKAYSAKMRALGKIVESHWFDGGNDRLAIEQTIEHQERMLRFACRILEQVRRTRDDPGG